MDQNREIGKKPKCTHTKHCKGGTTDQWGKDGLHIVCTGRLGYPCGGKNIKFLVYTPCTEKNLPSELKT